MCLGPRLSVLHGIIIYKVGPDKFLHRHLLEFYHMSDIEGKEKVERT